MNPVRIKVMSDDFLVFSLPCGVLQTEFLNKYDFEYAVIISPSVEADFHISTYSKGKRLIIDNYAAAISAAAFLVLKRGLPLSEISFETPSGIVNIFCTGDSMFKVLITECKELCTKSKEILGCEIEYTDVLLWDTVRVVKAKNIEAFDVSALPVFLLAGGKLPDSVVLSSKRDKKLSVIAYNKFNPAPLTTLHSFAAAAYLEKTPYKEKIFFEDNVSYCIKDYSTLTVATKPAVIG